jgi:hypothetical protein
MESTANEMAMVEWLSRFNHLKRNRYTGTPLIDLSEEYYTRFLKISEVLIQLILHIEDKLQDGRPCIFEDRTDYNLLTIGGSIGCTVDYSVDSRSSTITIGEYFTPHVRIGMIRTDFTFEVLEDSTFVGQGMILLGSSGYYSAYGVHNMYERTKESIEYLKNEKYRTFMIYGKHIEAPIDLFSYEGVVEQIIQKAKDQGYIE